MHTKKKNYGRIGDVREVQRCVCFTTAYAVAIADNVKVVRTRRLVAIDAKIGFSVISLTTSRIILEIHGMAINFKTGLIKELIRPIDIPIRIKICQLDVYFFNGKSHISEIYLIVFINIGRTN